jgi:hypothetical protein
MHLRGAGYLDKRSWQLTEGKSFKGEKNYHFFHRLLLSPYGIIRPPHAGQKTTPRA